MRIILLIAVCTPTVSIFCGCGVLPTPRTDAALAAIYAPARPQEPLTQEEIDARVAAVEERFDQKQVRKDAKDLHRRTSDYQQHMIDNAARRRNGQPNLPYEAKEKKEDGESVGDVILAGFVESARKRRAIERAKKPDPPPTAFSRGLSAAVITPFTFTADVIGESAKAVHKAALGMSSNEYRSRYDDWDDSGAFD